MGVLARLAAALALLCLPAAADATAREEVAVELVLAIDTSASIDDREYALQIEGIARAFRHPDVHAAIAALRPGGLAVSLLQWNDASDTRLAVPFAHITDEREARAFAFLVALAPRSGQSSLTDIGAGLTAALALLEAGAFEGRKRIVDVSGDGRSNVGPDPEIARGKILSGGIVINGLAILTDDRGLVDYYRRSVIGGPGAFVERADDYDSFAEAFLRKLLREFLPQVGAADR